MRIGLLALLATPSLAFGQVAFTDNTTALASPTLTSGVAIAVSDIDNDGLDDLVRLANTNRLEIDFQQPDGTFASYVHPTPLTGSEWALTIADVDRNGVNDIFTGGAYNGLKLTSANADGSSFTTVTLPGPEAGNTFLQNANFVDINNDGAIDIFATHDDGLSRPYGNDGVGGFTHDISLIDTSSPTPSDNSGNYGSIWTDIDLDGDLDLYLSKCRLNVTDPLDGRRQNLLFRNDGAGVYTETAAAVGLQPGGQTWATDFGDVDNDGDLDAFMINHDIQSALYLNNGGVFDNRTATAELDVHLTPDRFGIQAMFADFDNDTFLDILYTTNSGDQDIFWNDGDGTFTADTGFATTGGVGMQSAALGDLNNDGFLDVVGGYADGFNSPSTTPDQLFINQGNANGFFKVDLQGTVSNPNAIGARVELHGAWGVQQREVRAGQSYGIQNTFTVHFGLGTATQIDRVVVHWPAGGTTEILEPTPDTTLEIIEEGCGDIVYRDADGDGFGSADESQLGCVEDGWVANMDDCRDEDPAINPAAQEICGNAMDEDCDGLDGRCPTPTPTPLPTTPPPPSEEPGGCDTSPGGAMGLWLLGLAFLRRRNQTS